MQNITLERPHNEIPHRRCDFRYPPPSCGAEPHSNVPPPRSPQHLLPRPTHQNMRLTLRCRHHLTIIITIAMVLSSRHRPGTGCGLLHLGVVLKCVNHSRVARRSHQVAIVRPPWQRFVCRCDTGVICDAGVRNVARARMGGRSS